jgi:CubicO group peptidase (beta-lactamase class C family)
MELVDQGRVNLDESIRTYLPEYPAVGQAVTVRHLLNHTCGIVSYTAQSEYWKRMNDDLSHETIASWFSARDLAYTPGDRYVYSNSGYFLLGLIIERVSGESFGEFVKREIVDPAGLHETQYDDGKKPIANAAKGYARDGGKLVPPRQLNIDLAFSAGAMTSSVMDIYAFHQALRAGKLVTPESYAIMTSPAWLNDGSFTAYGMGFHVDDWDGHHVLRHGGLVFGFKTCVYYYPEQDLTVVILMNTEEAQYRPIQSAIARMFIPDLPAAIDYE